MKVECPAALSEDEVEAVVSALWEYSERSEEAGWVTKRLALGRSVGEGIVIVELEYETDLVKNRRAGIECRLYGLATPSDLAELIADLKRLARARRDYEAARKAFEEGRTSYSVVLQHLVKADGLAKQLIVESRAAAVKLHKLGVSDWLTIIFHKP